MAERNAPPLRWLLGDRKQRRKAWRYWAHDTGIGLLNTTIHYALRPLPVDLCSNLGALMGALGQLRMPEKNELAREAWLRLRPDETDPAIVDAALKRLWRNIGRSLAECSVLDRMWKQGRIRVAGAEHLSAARAAGKRVIVVAVHLGNWEAIGRVLIGLGYKGAAIYEVPENRFEHRIVQRFRRRYGGKLLPQGSSGARAAYRALFEMDGLLLLIDDIADGYVVAPGFGRALPIDGNIAFVARLALLADAEIVPAYCLREDESAQLKVTFLPPIDLVRAGDRKAAVTANMARINAAFEPLVQANLDQWYYANAIRFSSPPSECAFRRS
jgi:Kdo2-lipid IVA lauroyltransferase/acyltransferase